MATYVNSSSTLAQVKAAYDDNADYDVAADADKARRFIVAGRLLIRRIAGEASKGPESYKLNVEQIAEAVGQAEQWLAHAGAGASGPGRVTFGSFANYRGPEG